jgi:multidrug efflux pump subunit AcrA (membrane-fusion protein)
LVVADQTAQTKKAAEAALVSANAAGTQIKVMRTQARHMESQLQEMKTASEIAKANTEAARAQLKAMKDRERERLSIQKVHSPLLAFKSEGAKPDIPMRISMQIVNEGSSIAFNVAARGHVSIGKVLTIQELRTLEDNPEDWYRLAIPWTIPPTIGPSSKTEIVLTHMAGVLEEEWEPIEERTAKALQDAELLLRIGGEITYEDIFGDTHKTPFLAVWLVGGEDGGGMWRLRSTWRNLSKKST